LTAEAPTTTAYWVLSRKSPTSYLRFYPPGPLQTSARNIGRSRDMDVAERPSFV